MRFRNGVGGLAGAGWMQRELERGWTDGSPRCLIDEAHSGFERQEGCNGLSVTWQACRSSPGLGRECDTKRLRQAALVCPQKKSKKVP
ncbi:hypothetical protein SKAU_G00241410 [Synaphobranchus kaupii]|uniref:Uncharacterized protein n=1 Tax=Synaphobranchus kaupii TaxID=118154 RepID=A0A9Q1F7T3_SYNKA|nr:hypothetical protein SKAU_G00241410 [Synaphobranchus kaupii]